jgi:hypothetical protein
VSSATLYPTLDLKSSPNANAESLAILAHGVVFKLMGVQRNPDQMMWYQVKVCGQLSGQSPTDSPSAQPRINFKSSVGYIPATDFQRVAVTVDIGTLNLEGCSIAVQQK